MSKFIVFVLLFIVVAGVVGAYYFAVVHDGDVVDIPGTDFVCLNTVVRVDGLYCSIDDVEVRN